MIQAISRFILAGYKVIEWKGECLSLVHFAGAKWNGVKADGGSFSDGYEKSEPVIL